LGFSDLVAEAGGPGGSTLTCRWEQERAAETVAGAEAAFAKGVAELERGESVSCPSPFETPP